VLRPVDLEVVTEVSEALVSSYSESRSQEEGLSVDCPIENTIKVARFS